MTTRRSILRSVLAVVVAPMVKLPAAKSRPIARLKPLTNYGTRPLTERGLVLEDKHLRALKSLWLVEERMIAAGVNDKPPEPSNDQNTGIVHFY